MQPAYIYYTDGKRDSNKSVPKSIFTQRPTIVKPGMWQKKFRSDNCPGCLKSTKKIENNQTEWDIEHTCQFKSCESIETANDIGDKKSPFDSEEKKRNRKSSINHGNDSQKISTNKDVSLYTPFVVDSFAARLDIIPITKLPPSGLLYCENLPSNESIYTGPPSRFLDKDRLSKLAILLMLPNDTERLTEVDSTTSTRLKKYSNFICPCGHISDIMGKDNHQKECYISITTDAIRLSNYQSLMPKMCSEIELNDLPRIEYTEKNEVGTIANAMVCATGRTIYFGIETGDKCGRVTRDYVDSNKRPKHLQKAYKCPACSFWCIELLRFSTHFSTHVTQKAFGCSVCEYRSEKDFGVSRHIQLRKWKDILHKDAVVLSGNGLRQNRFAQFKAYIVITNCAQKRSLTNS